MWVENHIYNEVNPVPTSSVHSGVRLSDIKVNKRRLGHMHFFFFSTMAPAHQYKSLNLCGNNIRDEGAAAIGEALRGNGVLTFDMISRCCAPTQQQLQALGTAQCSVSAMAARTSPTQPVRGLSPQSCFYS